MYRALEARRKQPGAPDPNGMPGMFQIYAFSTRIGRFVRALREARERAATRQCTVVLLCERSVWTDRAVFKQMLVESGDITAVQSSVYDGCFEAWEHVVADTRPALAVWLDTPPERCLVRYAQRAREGEALSHDYATALDAQHRRVFGAGEFQGARVLRLDGSPAFHKQPDELRRMASQIRTALDELCAAEK